MPELLVPDTRDVRVRSINVTLDSATPQRIAHFVPTAKSARLMRSWLYPEQSPSSFVIAPYGTGKSLAATFFIQVVENLPKSGVVLGPIAERFCPIDGQLGDHLRLRIGSEQMPLIRRHGATVALSGFQPHLPTAIKQSLIGSLRRTGNRNAAAAASRRRADSMDDLIALLSAVRDRYCPDPIDRMAIVWDEFGRHLEELVVRGTAGDLSDVQTLAEFCARTRRAPITFALLLHQGLIRYAANTSVTVQREWKKIEGRFETVQFVDDSKDLYQLVSRIVRDLRSCGAPDKDTLRRGARMCREVGLFEDFSTQEMERLLSDSYPLDPATLHLLPRVSARVAQNERTLFTYLYALQAAESVSPDNLYDYFADAMRADTLPGGSYHTWLETESALRKARGGIDEKTLKCACLLGLGMVGERSRVSRRLLECAVAGYLADTAARDTVQRLIDAKLLLYRRHADSVSIWHGTDLDLRGRLDQEKERIGMRFDHVSFLMSEAPPAPWKPIDYNVEYGVERSFETRYVAATAVMEADSITKVLPPIAAADGILYVVVPDSPEESEDVRRRLSAEALAPCVVVAVPRHVDRVAEVALDVRALHLLRQDNNLLAEDPLVESELAQMIDDAQGYLVRLLSRMSQPSAEGPEYLWDRRLHEIASAKELRLFLSGIMRKVFPLTPRIRNEVIVRRRPRPAIVNARKKLILGILERSGTENLGLEGYRPDMSMFRTVLLLTGLYRRNGERQGDDQPLWGYAAPEELEDSGLRAVWAYLQDYLTVPTEHPKPLSDLVSRLSEPPYGIRPGVIPILLAAALRAFPAPISITRIDGTYITDLLPSTIEAIAADAAEYQVLVLELTADQKALLEQVAAMFGGATTYTSTSAEADPVRRCHDALVQWRSTLPRTALTSRYLSPAARSFGRLMTTVIDPYKLLFDAVPDELDVPNTGADTLLRALADCKAEMDGVVQWNYEAAERAIRSAFPALTRTTATLRQVAGSWAAFFPGSVTAQGVKDYVARAFITCARTDYRTDQALADAMASLLVGRRIDRWEDGSIMVFERELTAVIRRVEDAVLNLAADAHGLHKQSIRDIATSRLRASLRTIATVAGTNEARSIAEHVLNEVAEEVNANGTPA